jgi:hypothetical protein
MCGRKPRQIKILLGIDKLYSIGAKGHIYIHVQVCKYAENPLTGGKNIIYKYTSNTPLKLMVDP